MMEYIEGGELFKLIQKQKKLESYHAKFYAAQIITVFEYLHDRHQMVYRDLKPENVLL
jgi:serine/threonine protein kinase